MSELSDRFDRQAAWQRSRASLSWTKKLRIALTLRQAALALRASGRSAAEKASIMVKDLHVSEDVRLS